LNKGLTSIVAGPRTMKEQLVPSFCIFHPLCALRRTIELTGRARREPVTQVRI
jgi:hypothetical protein